MLTQRRKISYNFTVFRAYFGERACKAVGERFERHYYLSRVDYERKIRNRWGRRVIGGNIPL
jgi:hypothetical protein